MSRYPHKNLPLKKVEPTKKKFETKKGAQLGTKKSPAQVSVQSDTRREELKAIFKENNWCFDIKLDADAEENIRDLEFLQNKQGSAVSSKKAQRNDPCPCGSGKKYKKCCAA